MRADQSAFADTSGSIKGGRLSLPESHCYCGCKRLEGLRCWSRDIAGTQRHPTMQNYQQNSYNINAGYNTNLLTVGSYLPAVFRVVKKRPRNTKDIRHYWRVLRHCLTTFALFLLFLWGFKRTAYSVYMPEYCFTVMTFDMFIFISVLLYEK